jgi:hypothetical protein
MLLHCRRTWDSDYSKGFSEESCENIVQTKKESNEKYCRILIKTGKSCTRRVL